MQDRDDKWGESDRDGEKWSDSHIYYLWYLWQVTNLWRCNILYM